MGGVQKNRKSKQYSAPSYRGHAEDDVMKREQLVTKSLKKPDNHSYQLRAKRILKKAGDNNYLTFDMSASDFSPTTLAIITTSSDTLERRFAADSVRPL